MVLGGMRKMLEYGASTEYQATLGEALIKATAKKTLTKKKGPKESQFTKAKE